MIGDRRVRAMSAALLLVSLSGCTMATPFRGPGFDVETGVSGTAPDPLLVVVTEADLGGDWFQRRTFWRNVSRVVDSLGSRPGFIGHSRRMEVFGSKAWTVTVWTDEPAMRAFVAGDVHQRAIAESAEALAAARFARFTVPRAEVPVSWDKALAALAASSRGYD